jgi:hypothetical protein
MTRLKKGIRELRRERHFFKLAAAHFAKEELSLKSINSGIYKAPIFQSTGWPTSYTSRVAVTTPGCIVKIILAHVPGNEDELGEAIEPFFKDHKERYGSFRIHHELRGQGFGVSR